jgi:Cu-Zn family superoxide dismutase
MSAYRYPPSLSQDVPTTFRRDFRAWIGTMLILMGSLVVPVTSASAWNLGAEAKLYNTALQPVGIARLIQLGGGNVLVQVRVHDLPPGFHGFHVHAVGECTPGTPDTPHFASAGGHFDLGRAPPTPPHSHKDHSGDFPVLLVNTEGTANAIFNTDRFEVADLFDVDSSAIIIHAEPDNYTNIPSDRYIPKPPAPSAPMPDAITLRTGDSGGRIVCGVVKKLIDR